MAAAPASQVLEGSPGSAPGVSDGSPGRLSARARALRYGLPVIVLCVSVAFVGVLAYGVIAQRPSSGIDASLARGRPVRAPSFELAILSAGRLGPQLTRRLAGALRTGRVGPRQLRGIPFVLNIWASWCVPCRQEAPVLERAWRLDGRPRGVLFVGLDMQDAAPDGRGFLRQFGVDYLNVRDPSNDVPRRYGATGVPETFFIGRRGMIVGHVIGVISPAALHRGIASSITGEVLGARQGGARRPSR